MQDASEVTSRRPAPTRDERVQRAEPLIPHAHSYEVNRSAPLLDDQARNQAAAGRIKKTIHVYIKRVSALQSAFFKSYLLRVLCGLFFYFAFSPPTIDRCGTTIDSILAATTRNEVFLNIPS